MNPNLPSWATLRPIERTGKVPVIEVDAVAAYTAILADLNVSEPDQYWLEVAYQFIMLDLQTAMRTFAFEIHIHDRERRWSQKFYPTGRGAAKASRGLEAREHFRRLRGFATTSEQYLFPAHTRTPVPVRVGCPPETTLAAQSVGQAIPAATSIGCCQEQDLSAW